MRKARNKTIIFVSNKTQGENMKSLIIAFSIVILSLHAFADDCDTLINGNNGYANYVEGGANWGNTVEVTNKTPFYFYYMTTENVKHLDVFFQNHDGFKCSLVEISRFSNSCVVIGIDWSPGSDSSGCIAYLANTKTKHLWPSSALFQRKKSTNRSKIEPR